MRCSDAERMLARVLDGDWDTMAARMLHVHLSECTDCRELFANLLLVRAMCRVAREFWGKKETCQS